MGWDIMYSTVRRGVSICLVTIQEHESVYMSLDAVSCYQIPVYTFCVAHQLQAGDTL
jgi:hypothetical protein